MSEFNNNAVKLLNQITADKIHEKMRKLRMNTSENDKRRWIWELIQNAKDNTAINFPDKKVSICIEVKENQLIFSHNYGYFTKSNVEGLIRQISSDEKDRDSQDTQSKPPTTGRFGTGFMTTHLLSPVVKISGIYKRDNNNIFSINFTIDRNYDGNRKSTIEKNINSSFEEAEELKVLDTSRLELNEQNTKFIYEITNESSREIMYLGINDLKKSLLYSLIFVEEISSITIIEKNKISIYEYGIPSKISGHIYSTSIKVTENEESHEERFVYAKKDLTTIVIKVDAEEDTFKVLNLSEETPKLYLDFPLIGTESFGLPFIINNPFFEPTEPRDGIFLTENEDQGIKNNKEIISLAIELFFELLDYAANNQWKDIYQLVNIDKKHNYNWLSKDWYDSLLKEMYSKLTNTSMIQLNNGNVVSVKNCKILFPSHPVKEVREKLWNLAHQILPNQVPLKIDIHNWYNVLWKDCFRFSLLILTKHIDDCKTTDTISEYFEGDLEKTINWLNEYYDLLNYEGNVIKNITNNEYAVIPAQDKTLNKVMNLRRDDDIEDELKDIAKLLGKDYRKILRMKSIDTKSRYETKTAINHNALTQKVIVNEINERLYSNHVSKENKAKAVFHLISCLPSERNVKRNKIYYFSKSIYKNQNLPKKILKKSSQIIWEKADKIILLNISQEISKAKNVSELEQKIENEENESVFDWLENFALFLVSEEMDNLLNNKEYPILPNQNGNFKIKDELNLDDETNEELKNICKELGYDFRKELLASEIKFDLPANRVRESKDIASKVDELVNENINSDKDERTKLIFKKLFLWLNENADLAKKILKSLYDKRHRLRDDEDIIVDIQKAQEYDKLKEKFGVADSSEFEELINLGLASKNKDTEETISLNTLISLGITTQKELERVMSENQNLAERFKHISVRDFEWFKAAKRKIERAKSNVKKFLINNADYDCTDWEELSTTVIGGITKKDEDIFIVVRPSDSGEVIFYYGAEKDTLEYSNTELWVEDGTSNPELITLGRILKDNFINKVRIKN